MSKNQYVEELARQNVPYSAVFDCRIRQFVSELPDKAVKEESREISGDNLNCYVGEEMILNSPVSGYLVVILR
jgi:hypothetical protein